MSTSDFWFDPGHADHAGTITAAPPVIDTAEGSRVGCRVEAEWRAHDNGQPLVRATRRWVLRGMGKTWRLELDWALGSKRSLTIGAPAYGGLSLRMPCSVGGWPIGLRWPPPYSSGSRCRRTAR